MNIEERYVWSIQGSVGLNKNKSYTVLGFQSVVNTWYYKYQVANQLGHLIDNSNLNFFDTIGQNPMKLLRDLFSNRTIFDSKFVVIYFCTRINYHDQYAKLNSFRLGHDYSPRVALVYIPKIKFQNKSLF